MLAEGAVADAAQTFAAILAEDEANLAAIGGLARAHLAMGDLEQARGILALAPKGKENDALIAAVRAQIDLAEASAEAGDAGRVAARRWSATRTTTRRATTSRTALVGEGRHGGRGRGAARAVPPRPRVERRRGQDAAVQAVRQPRAEERGGGEGPAAAVVDDLRLKWARGEA